MYTKPIRSDELVHYGVLGMHWGVRRYQPYVKGDRVEGGIEVGQAKKLTRRLDRADRKEASNIAKALERSAEIDRRTAKLIRRRRKFVEKQSNWNARRYDKAKEKLLKSKDKASKVLESHKTTMKEMNDCLSGLKSNGYNVYAKRVSRSREVTPAAYRKAQEMIGNKTLDGVRTFTSARVIYTGNAIMYQTTYNIAVDGHKYKIRSVKTDPNKFVYK